MSLRPFLRYVAVRLFLAVAVAERAPYPQQAKCLPPTVVLQGGSTASFRTSEQRNRRTVATYKSSLPRSEPGWRHSRSARLASTS